MVLAATVAQKKADPWRLLVMLGHVLYASLSSRSTLLFDERRNTRGGEYHLSNRVKYTRVEPRTLLKEDFLFPANVIGFSFGAVIGFPSAILTDLQKRYSAEQISWIITAGTMGGVIGSVLWSQLTPRVGPKKSAYITGIPMLISWCLLLNIGNYNFVIAGRFISGISMGGLTSTVPHYVNDITEDSLRGALGSFLVLGYNAGTLLVYLLGKFLDTFYVTVSCAVIPAAFLIIFLPCPESPVYLSVSGRADHSKHNLKRLRYPRDVTEELASYSLKSAVRKARWADLVTNRPARKTLLISMAMFSIAQMCGFIPLLSYVGEIFQKAGGSLDPLTSACIVTAVQLGASFIAIGLVDRMGRRILMMSSCVGMALCNGLLSYSLTPGSGTPEWLPVTAMSGFMISFSIGAGNCPYVIMNEMASPPMRPRIAAVNMLYQGILSVAYAKSYASMSAALGIHGVFLVYAGGSLVGLVITFFFLSETAGRSNNSIQEELEGKRVKQIA